MQFNVFLHKGKTFISKNRKQGNNNNNKLLLKKCYGFRLFIIIVNNNKPSKTITFLRMKIKPRIVKIVNIKQTIESKKEQRKYKNNKNIYM